MYTEKLNTTKHYYQYSTAFNAGEEFLTDDEHKLLNVFGRYPGETTNTDLLRKSKLKVSTKEIGKMIAELRARKLIQYSHVDSGSFTGNGRYEFKITSRYIGRINL